MANVREGSACLASSGDLARAIAAGTGLGLEVVQGYVKSLRTEGMLASSGRGLSAAVMQLDDAATMVCAVLATSSATRAPDAVRRLAVYQCPPIQADALACSFGLAPGRDLRFHDCVVEILFALATRLTPGASADVLPELAVSFQTPPGVASMVFRLRATDLEGSIEFRPPRAVALAPEGVEALGLGGRGGDLTQVRSFTRLTLALVAAQVVDAPSVVRRLGKVKRVAYES